MSKFRRRPFPACPCSCSPRQLRATRLGFKNLTVNCPSFLSFYSPNLMEQLRHYLQCSSCAQPMRHALILPCPGAHRVCVSCTAAAGCSQCPICSRKFRKLPQACILTSHVARAVHGEGEQLEDACVETWLRCETVELARKFQHLMYAQDYVERVKDATTMAPGRWVRCECSVAPYAKNGFICVEQVASKTGRSYYACPRQRDSQCKFFRFK